MTSPLPFQLGTVMLYVQARGALSSTVIWLKSAARNVVPQLPIIFQISAGMSSGPVAFPFFIFFNAFWTSAVVIGVTGPATGSAGGIGGCVNSSLLIPAK